MLTLFYSGTGLSIPNPRRRPPDRLGLRTELVGYGDL